MKGERVYRYGTDAGFLLWTNAPWRRERVCDGGGGLSVSAPLHVGTPPKRKSSLKSVLIVQLLARGRNSINIVGQKHCMRKRLSRSGTQQVLVTWDLKVRTESRKELSLFRNTSRSSFQTLSRENPKPALVKRSGLHCVARVRLPP